MMLFKKTILVIASFLWVVSANAETFKTLQPLADIDYSNFSVVSNTNDKIKGGGLPVGWPWRGIIIDSTTKGNSPAVVRHLKLKGINAIELVLTIRDTGKFQNKSPTQAWQETLQWADNMLDECKNNQIVCIISLSQIPLDPKLNISQASPEFWDNPAMLDEAVRVAKAIADHFKGRGAELGAYEILNEPLVRRISRQESPAAWPSLIEKVVRVIRTKDANRFIVVNAGFGGEASQYAKFKPIPYDRIIYGAHVYNPHEYTHQGLYGNPLGMKWPGYIGKTYWDKERLKKQLSPLIEFKKKYGVPIWIGEFSALRWAQGSSEWLCDAVTIFNENEFGWMYFAFNGYHGWNPAYDTVFTSDARIDFDAHKIDERSERWSTLNKMYNGQCK